MRINDIYILGFIAILVLVGFSWVWSASRTDSILQNWANDNGYQLLSQERIWFSLDPFVMFSGKNRVVRRVEIQDRQGNLRHALVRVGGYWFGLMSNYCEVKWLD